MVTHFSEHPLLVQTVDEEDGRLGEGHEEVTEGQIDDEVVWEAPQLLVTGSVTERLSGVISTGRRLVLLTQPQVNCLADGTLSKSRLVSVN